MLSVWCLVPGNYPTARRLRPLRSLIEDRTIAEKSIDLILSRYLILLEDVTDVTDNYLLSLLFILPFLLIIYIDLSIVVKRLHDTNRSGWRCLWVLLAFILGVIFSGVPLLSSIIQFLFAIYFFVVCGCFKGTEGKNDYGHPVDKVIW